MSRDGERATIEAGMKVSVLRSGRQRIGVVARVEGDYVFVRWTHSDIVPHTEEYQAHRDDVTPLAGWV
jgi:hypothetical protein